MDYRLQNVSYLLSNYYSQPETLVKNWNKMNNSQTVHRRIVPNLSEVFKQDLTTAQFCFYLKQESPCWQFQCTLSVQQTTSRHLHRLLLLSSFQTVSGLFCLDPNLESSRQNFTFWVVFKHILLYWAVIWPINSWHAVLFRSKFQEKIKGKFLIVYQILRLAAESALRPGG